MVTSESHGFHPTNDSESETCWSIRTTQSCGAPDSESRASGDCYLVKDIGPTGHALDGTRTPDVEDFEDRVAIVMDGERIEDRRQAERIVLEQRLTRATRPSPQRDLFAKGTR